MEEKLTWVDFASLGRFMQEVLVKSGISEENAQICVDVMLAADMRGIDSHGINRLKPVYYDKIKEGRIIPDAEVKIIRETPATALIDGNHGIGFVTAKKAMQVAIDKAKIYGIGMTAVKNSNHFGIAGYYALMAAENDMIGITGTNARPAVAPTFSVEGMFGTNPLTFGIPTDEKFHFLLDCATSVGQRGKIEVYARIGKETPAGWVVDLNGNTRTDSEQILPDLISGKAALLPLGGIGEDTSGYKGYGYATVVEIMCAALQGGIFLKALEGIVGGKKVHFDLGHFFIAINVGAFAEPADFKKRTGDILRELRAAKKMPGADRIYTAGEKEYDIMMQRQDKGAPVNADLLEEMKQMAKELQITGYDFLL